MKSVKREELKQEMERLAMFPYTVLMIDDDKDFTEEAQKQAKSKNLNIIPLNDNLESAKEYMHSVNGKNINGVILDIEFYRKPDQQAADDSSVMDATNFFQREFPSLPLIILSGKPTLLTQWQKSMEGTYKPYSKTDLNEPFDDLRKKISESRDEDTKWAYKDVFQIIKLKYFAPDAEQKLLTCIKNIGELNNDEKDILNLRKSTVGLLRELQEKLYYALNRLDPEMLPADRISSEYSLNENVLKHLKGNHNGSRATTKEYIKHGSNTDRLLYFVYKGCSASLHSNEDKKNQETSNYTVKALVYAFLDLLLWFKTIAEQVR